MCVGTRQLRLVTAAAAGCLDGPVATACSKVRRELLVCLLCAQLQRSCAHSS